MASRLATYRKPRSSGITDWGGSSHSMTASFGSGLYTARVWCGNPSGYTEESKTRVQNCATASGSPRAAVPLELFDAGVVRRRRRHERGCGHVVGCALPCQLADPLGLCGRMLLDGPGVGRAGIVELPQSAVSAAKDLPQAGRRCGGEVLPQRRRECPAELARVEFRVSDTALQGSEREDRPVADDGLEQLVELDKAGTDVFGHVFRFSLALLDVKLLPFPLIGGSPALPVTLCLSGLPGGSRLGLLEFAKLPMTGTLALGTFPLYLCPKPLPLCHADPAQPMLAPYARALARAGDIEEG
jgi:hypothetical protein